MKRFVEGGAVSCFIIFFFLHSCTCIFVPKFLFTCVSNSVSSAIFLFSWRSWSCFYLFCFFVFFLPSPCKVVTCPLILAGQDCAVLLCVHPCSPPPCWPYRSSSLVLLVRERVKRVPDHFCSLRRGTSTFNQQGELLFHVLAVLRLISKIEKRKKKTLKKKERHLLTFGGSSYHPGSMHSAVNKMISKPCFFSPFFPNGVLIVNLLLIRSIVLSSVVGIAPWKLIQLLQNPTP